MVSSSDDHVAWAGRSPAVVAIRDAVIGHVPTGSLRLVLQQLALHEQGRPVGTHESIDTILDVHGNLVSMSIVDAVRADETSSQRLDRALAALRAEVVADLEAEVDSLELVADVDGTRRVMVVLSADVSPKEVSGPFRHRAVHDGTHHITHHAPELDELRDRVSAPEPSRLRRLCRLLTAGPRRARR